MDALARPIVPPVPKVHARPVNPLQLIWGMSTNPLTVWSEQDFEILVQKNQVLGRENWLVNDPAWVRHVMHEAMPRYRRPLASARPVRPVTGDGVLLAEGGEWRRQRKMLAPVFTPAHVGLMLPHFQAAAEGLVRRLQGAATANLSAAFHAATIDAVLRALFSLSDGADRADIARLARGYIERAGRPNIFDGYARSHEDFGFALASRRRFQRRWTAAVDGVVAARRSAARAGPHRDLLDLLLAARDEDGRPLPDAEVRDQAATLLFAGFETTSRLLFWAAWLLSLDTLEQDRLRAEVRAFPPERVTRLEDLEHWPRLRLVLLETLRLYPPVVFLLREAVEPDEIDGQAVSPGALVWMSPWVIHRHRKFWDQPDAFMPDRFAGQPSPWTGAQPYFPFGLGPRICIGASFGLAEAQIVLASLLSRFEIGLSSSRPVLPVGAVTTRPDHEPLFRLARA
ncbi:cytochrome P450 [Phenylobacterium sp.]|jgi:cytochrome P450|uniref:cytochrome P450 n=1 Tax=Phenylobacterium sp. TaxID=1871053 RepID=UPI002F94C251